MTTARDHLSKADTVTIAAIEAGVPMLVEARGLIDRFQSMIGMKAASGLEAWVMEASMSLIASFTSGIARDRVAVRATPMAPRIASGRLRHFQKRGDYPSPTDISDAASDLGSPAPLVALQT